MILTCATSQSSVNLTTGPHKPPHEQTDARFSSLLRFLIRFTPTYWINLIGRKKKNLFLWLTSTNWGNSCTGMGILVSVSLPAYVSTLYASLCTWFCLCIDLPLCLSVWPSVCLTPFPFSHLPLLLSACLLCCPVSSISVPVSLLVHLLQTEPGYIGSPNVWLW